MNTYEVKVSREGRWWMVSIPALDGLTQARRFTDVAEEAQETHAADYHDAEAARAAL